jgi:hypothetical protein
VSSISRDRVKHQPRLSRISRGHSVKDHPAQDTQEGPADVDQTWTNGDGEVIEFPHEIEQTEDLPADSEGGRYWDRTSDPCVVSADRSKPATSKDARFCCLRPLFDVLRDVVTLCDIALVWGTKEEQVKRGTMVKPNVAGDVPLEARVRRTSRHPHRILRPTRRSTSVETTALPRARLGMPR